MTIKNCIFLFISIALISFSCTSKNSNEEFKNTFQGNWKLKKLTGKRAVADSVITQFPVTLNVEDTAFLFRQATQYAGTTYRDWIFEDSILLLPYSATLIKEDTLRFKLLELTPKALVLQRKDSSNIELDTLYFERY